MGLTLHAHWPWWAVASTECFSCVLSSGEGVWSDQGCALIAGNLSYSVCRCTHLTNFAILMQVVPLEVRARPKGPGLQMEQMGALRSQEGSGMLFMGLCFFGKKYFCCRLCQAAPMQTVGPSSRTWRRQEGSLLGLSALVTVL